MTSALATDSADDTGDYNAFWRARDYRPAAGRVPVLCLEGRPVWDTLAIAETVAERIAPNASLLDTSISIYRVAPNGRWDLIANNDDIIATRSANFPGSVTWT